MSNPYAAPSADISSNTDNDTYDPKLLSMSGRIGRVRYIAYAIGVTMAIMLAAVVPMAIFPENAGVIGVAIILLYIPALFISMLMTVRRLHDMDHSGWWSLITFVPLLNMILGLMLLFRPGTSGRNSFGPAPSKNTGGVIALACVLPAVAIIGIMAAVAIPAYQAYVLKSQEAVQAIQDEALRSAEEAAEQADAEGSMPEPAAETETDTETETEAEPAPEPAPASEPASKT